MASPNISEIATTTIENRRRKLADNMTNNTALLNRLKARGKASPASGGEVLYEELEYDENATYKRFSGYEILNIQPSDVMTAAEFDWKQSAVAVTISERERLMNMGRERMIGLLEKRIGNAERTFINKLSADLYSDGTADGGKQINGLAAMVPSPSGTTVVDARVSSGTYGGIARGTWSFWRPYQMNSAMTANTRGTTRQTFVDLWVRLCRNMDKTDLIVTDNYMYSNFWKDLQDQERFTSQTMARAGFTSLKFGTSDVVLDGGVGGSAPARTAYFLNTNYIYWRPHSSANMTQLEDRFATNQAAMVKLIHWMGNLTCSNQELQGILRDHTAG